MKNILKICQTRLIPFDCFEATSERAWPLEVISAEFVYCKLFVVLFVTFNR